MFYRKEYIDVLTRFGKDGTILPICVYWPDGTGYTIERILDIRRASSLKTGDSGIRYTCMIKGQQTYIYLEENRWFAERKVKA